MKKWLCLILFLAFSLLPSFADYFCGSVSEASLLGIIGNDNYCGYKYSDGGGIYTNANMPLSLNKVNPSENIDLSKLSVGISKKRNYLGLIELGDASIMKAAQNGGIKNVKYVDIKKHKVFIPVLFIPIIVDGVITTVYGEKGGTL